jgi:serine/threonine protein phosphatase 1
MSRYAITDIHGCLKTFRKLVEEGIALQPTDELYLLGDYINKGPDSKGVLDYIRDLQEREYQVLCLRGNHDQLLIDACDEGEPSVWLSAEEKQLTLDSFWVRHFHEIPQVYVQFVRSLPFYHELDHFFLVHAGFDFSKPREAMFQDTHSMLNLKEFEVAREKINGKRLLHGHLPEPLDRLRLRIRRESPNLNLDTGCVYHQNQEFGQLVALNLDSLELTVQPNIDQPYPVKKK